MNEQILWSVRGEDMVLFRILKNELETAGIPYMVKNEMLVYGMGGELPVVPLEIWIVDGSRMPEAIAIRDKILFKGTTRPSSNDIIERKWKWWKVLFIMALILPYPLPIVIHNWETITTWLFKLIGW